MSTVAWDGTTLAGDRLAVRGEGLRLESQKVFQLHDGQLFGGVGLYDSVLKVLWWLQGIDEKPVLGNEDRFSGILVHTTGTVCLYDEALVPKPILESFCAIGSGRDFALAAMALGQNAIEAIELAKRFDVYTGMGTDHYAIGGAQTYA